MSHHKFQSCISICLECASLCHQCAFECLKETESKMLAKCIQLARECAEMCLSTARILTLGSEHAKDVCIVCADYCYRCAVECEKYPELEHCTSCAEVCHKCMEECHKLIRDFVRRN